LGVHGQDRCPLRARKTEMRVCEDLEKGNRRGVSINDHLQGGIPDDEKVHQGGAQRRHYVRPKRGGVSSAGGGIGIHKDRVWDWRSLLRGVDERTTMGNLTTGREE